jgi:hypothetical protein
MLCAKITTAQECEDADRGTGVPPVPRLPKHGRDARATPCRRLPAALLVLACLSAAPPVPPTTQPLGTFVRFAEDGHGGGQMQVAVTSYRNDDGSTVDLLSTVHIGDVAFFRQLAKRLNGYDAVLFELVAHRGEPATEEGVNPQQARIASEMSLENQGPHMNYDRPSFVHADLDLEDLQAQEKAAHGTTKGMLGEGPGLAAATSADDTAGLESVYADLKAAAAVDPGKQGAPHAKGANAKEYARLMRRAYARLLSATAEPAAGSTYPVGADMDILVGARNQHVMDVLAQQTEAGKHHLAILFGGAHMVDLEHRLLSHGYQRTATTWVTAWTVAPDGTPTTRPAVKR